MSGDDGLGLHSSRAKGRPLKHGVARHGAVEHAREPGSIAKAPDMWDTAFALRRNASCGKSTVSPPTA